jgi:hypothetical protein
MSGWRLSKEWVKKTIAALQNNETVRMTTSSRKLFLLSFHDEGMDLEWKSLGSGVWEARLKTTDDMK